MAAIEWLCVSYISEATHSSLQSNFLFHVWSHFTLINKLIHSVSDSSVYDE